MRPRYCRCRRSSTHAKTPPVSNNLKIWEYRVSDAASVFPAANTSTDPSSSSSSTALQTLYTPSQNPKDGWDVSHTKAPVQNGPLPEPLSKPNKLPSMDTLSFQMQRVVRHFLPAGYPTSVAPGYKRYVGYCIAANTFGSASMVLSTQTLLLAVGVGSSATAPMAAAINWVMKDGIGQLGGILFASKLGSAANSSIDSDPKRWRVASSLSMDCATWLEILSPLFPQYFLPIASVANVGKNIGFLTASASRAAIHQALALKSNLGDVTAKAGSQSILASLAGTTLGISISPLLQGDVANVAIGFALLSVFHQYCTYNAVRSVHLRNLNRHRLNLVLEKFVESIMRVSAKSENAVTQRNIAVLSPAEVAEIEKFLPFIHRDETKQWLVIGSSLTFLFPTKSEYDNVLECIGKKEDYLINHGNNVGPICLTFLKDAEGKDLIRGMLHAHILRAMLISGSGQEQASDLIKTSYGEMISLIGEFMKALEMHGWEISTETVQVEAGEAKRLQIQDR